MKHLVAILSVSLLCSLAVVHAQQFPLWERLLHAYGGSSDQTPVPSTNMGDHMQMSVKAPLQPGDRDRADRIVAAARRVVAQ